jgi:hypothetical protein
MSSSTRIVRMAGHTVDRTVSDVISRASQPGEVTFRVTGTQDGIVTVELSGNADAVHHVYERGCQDGVW